jgi:hypothetical protein
MTPQNAATHAKIAADALERLVRDVQNGRAQWGTAQSVRQAAADLTRLSTAVATATQQMAAALAQEPRPGPYLPQALAALHGAGQAETTAAGHLRQASRTIR